VVFRNTLWVIGGLNSDGPVNSVLYSSDGGVTWDVAATPPWQPRHWSYYLNGAAVFDGLIWIAGGWSQGGAMWTGDLWFTADGTTWMQASTPPWAGSYDVVTVAGADDALYALTTDQNNNNSLWRTLDGQLWDAVSTPDSWTVDGASGVGLAPYPGRGVLAVGNPHAWRYVPPLS
jgi:hypothetical protein